MAQNTARDLRTSMATPTTRSRPAPITISDKTVRAGKLGTIDRTQQREERSKYLQDQAKKRSSGSMRLQGMAVYQPRKGGTPLLTNRITKYDSMKTDYQRIRIKFDPIIKPDRWGATFGRYTDTDIHKYVDHYAQKYNIDASLLSTIIKVESAAIRTRCRRRRGGADAAYAGDGGGFERAQRVQTAENIGGGAQYISKMLGMFEDEVRSRARGLQRLGKCD